tara:strand:+ start:82 stop:669 length:588 start_codon:yes stop_codon:yes gene_type:complete
MVMDKESFTKGALNKNKESAYAAYAADDAYAYAAYAAYAYAADHWIDMYFKETGENKQDYIDEIKRVKESVKEKALEYTQAMADNVDFLPPVNMIVKHKGVKKIVTGELDYNNNLALKSIDNELYSVGHIYDIEPLTPPIKLIDGKAYQFELDGIVCVGFYVLARNSFMDRTVAGNKICGKVEPNNIQPLTVEVK